MRRRWTEARVRYLRALYRTGEVSMMDIAVMERAPCSNVSEMLTGVSYKHVTGALTLEERKAMNKKGFRLNVWNAADQTVIPVRSAVQCIKTTGSQSQQ